MYCNTRRCNILSFFGEWEDRSKLLSKQSDGWTQYSGIRAFFRIGSSKEREKKKEITDISRAVKFKGYAWYFYGGIV